MASNNVWQILLETPEKFDFTSISLQLWGKPVYYSSIKEIYNPIIHEDGSIGRGRGMPETKRKGVYALYSGKKLLKIGKAADGDGMFHRMGQYYRGDPKGGSDKITPENRDKINVRYINFCTAKECWIAERMLQCVAYYKGETMPWEAKK